MMMTILMGGGDGGNRGGRTVDAPPWSSIFEEAATGSGYHVGGEFSLEDSAALVALRRQVQYGSAEKEEAAEDLDGGVDLYTSDEFRMYEFKVRRCARGRSHDWTECPFAHPGEKARRRDPRKYHYSGTACPDFRKGCCKRGDACEFAHGVFECWLHPARYRTQPCKDGTACRRRVCFFAHTPDQLRFLSPQQQAPMKASAVAESYDGSPLRQQALESYISKRQISSSPTSTLMSPPTSPPSDSPPVSPSTTALLRASWPAGTSVSEIVATMQQMQLSKTKSLPSSWNLQLGNGLFGSPSPRGATAATGYMTGFRSVPTTPTTAGLAGGGMGWFDGVESGIAEEVEAEEEEEPVKRVESGRALRAKLFEKLSKECVTERPDAVPPAAAPDVGWVSELVKW